MTDWTKESTTNVFTEPMPTLNLEEIMAMVAKLGPPKRLRARGVHKDDVLLLREWLRDAIAKAGGGVGLLFGPETIPIEVSEFALRGKALLFWETRWTDPSDAVEKWQTERFIVVNLRADEEAPAEDG